MLRLFFFSYALSIKFKIFVKFYYRWVLFSITMLYNNGMLQMEIAEIYKAKGDIDEFKSLSRGKFL